MIFELKRDYSATLIVYLSFILSLSNEFIKYNLMIGNVIRNNINLLINFLYLQFYEGFCLKIK